MAVLEAITLLTSWWYYVPLVSVAAVAIDMILRAAIPRRFAPIVATALAIAGVMFFLPSLRSARPRQTNVDLIATAIARRARPHDMIVVSGWPHGVSYHRYHASSAPWETAPPLSSHEWHRWDEAATLVGEIRAMDSLVAKVRERLHGGGSVYVLADRPLAKTPPPPLPPFRGTTRQSSFYWSRQLHHALTASPAAVVHEVRPGDNVMPQEHLTLQVWQRISRR